MVKIYFVMTIVAVCVVALGLFGVMDGDQCGKVLLGIVAIIQGMKELVREKRGEKNNEKPSPTDKP